MTPYLFATALDSSYYSLTKRGTVDLGTYWKVKNKKIHLPPPPPRLFGTVEHCSLQGVALWPLIIPFDARTLLLLNAQQYI